MTGAEQKLNAFERAFSEELQMTKTAGLSKTAADQFDEILVKLSAQTKCSCGGAMVKTGEITKCSKCGGKAKHAAALDGSDIMGKLNPVGRTQSGVDARSVDVGLRQLIADKHGRGVAEKTNRDRVMRKMRLEQTVQDPAIFSAEEGSYPLRPTSGVPKVSSDMLKAAAALKIKRDKEKKAYSIHSTVQKLAAEGQLRTLEGWR